MLAVINRIKLLYRVNTDKIAFKPIRSLKVHTILEPYSCFRVVFVANLFIVVVSQWSHCIKRCCFRRQRKLRWFCDSLFENFSSFLLNSEKQFEDSRSGFLCELSAIDIAIRNYSKICWLRSVVHRWRACNLFITISTFIYLFAKVKVSHNLDIYTK